MQKGGHLDIFEYPRIKYHFACKKWTCRPTLKRGRVADLFNNVTHMRPVQICVRQTQNLPETSRDLN